jgi:hypothetical protein
MRNAIEDLNQIPTLLVDESKLRRLQEELGELRCEKHKKERRLMTAGSRDAIKAEAQALLAGEVSDGHTTLPQEIVQLERAIAIHETAVELEINNLAQRRSFKSAEILGSEMTQRLYAKNVIAKQITAIDAIIEALEAKQEFMLAIEARGYRTTYVNETFLPRINDKDQLARARDELLLRMKS